MSKTKVDAHEEKQDATEPVERRQASRMTDAELKAWVRKELALAAVGHTVAEREAENP
jgi:hypothetical protein